MLKNETWQLVPGKENTLLYPIIKKTNITTSNSFIFQSPKVIMIIDPGDLPEQIADIRRVIGEVLKEGGRPVFAYLTHCHVDHCFEFLHNPSGIAPEEIVFVAIQEKGFDAIGRKDRELTGAGRYRKAIPDPNIDICLLSAEDRRFDITKRYMLTEGIQMDMTTKTFATYGENTLSRQDFLFNGDMISVYYTPGHSPDSISFQVGDILFVGDLMFAADPFIAGLPGWCKSSVTSSAQNLLWLIENEKIAMVAQGHGEVIPSEKAKEYLKKMIDRLPGIIVRKELDLPAILASSEYAVDLSREVIDIVSVMTESLSRVVYYLYILEESEEASKYEEVLDSEKLNRLFSAFNAMIDEMHSGKLIEVGLVLRSAILFNKIREMLKAEGLESVVGQALLTRLERSFDDFIVSSSGREIKQNVMRFEARALIHHIIDALKEDIHADPSILETLEDDHLFITSLTRRIAFKPVSKYVKFSLTCEKDVLIESDWNRLSEIIDIMVELMIDEGSKEIAFSISEGEGAIHITIDGGLTPKLLADDCYQKRSLIRRLRWINGSFNLRNQEDSTIIDLEIPSLTQEMSMQAP